MERPYRIWHEQGKRDLPHRYYSEPGRALDRALVLARWEAIGASLTVYNTATGRRLATYTHRVHAIHFTGKD